LAVAFLAITPYRTISVHRFIDDGGTYTLELGGYGSRLHVRLSSSYGYMGVRVVADGKVIYHDPRTYEASLERNLGFGYHVIHVIIENPPGYPTWPWTGGRILVAGLVGYYLL